MALATPYSRSHPTLPGLRPDKESPGWPSKTTASGRGASGCPSWRTGWGNIGISYEMGRLDEVWVGAKSRACSRGTSYLERLKQICSSIRVLLV